MNKSIQCIFFKKGRCSKSNCNFSHDAIAETPPCKFGIRCRNGAKCLFSHSHKNKLENTQEQDQEQESKKMLRLMQQKLEADLYELQRKQEQIMLLDLIKRAEKDIQELLETEIYSVDDFISTVRQMIKPSCSISACQSWEEPQALPDWVITAPSYFEQKIATLHPRNNGIKIVFVLNIDCTISKNVYISGESQGTVNIKNVKNSEFLKVLEYFDKQNKLGNIALY